MSAVAGGSSKLEQSYDIPTAPVSTLGFKSVVDSNPMSAILPFVYTPHPVIGMSPEALDAYIEGKDPDTGNIVIEEIIDTLTKPVAVKQAPVDVPAPADAAPPVLLEPDTEDNLQKLFYEKGWTDGLPIILPTEERVQRMLAGTSAAPDDVVGESFQMSARRFVKYTVLNTAVIAVMAGAGPEHFPAILATAATRQPSLMPSTTAFEAMLLVNGPIRNEIGMNCGIGAFSAVNRANSVLGRAWTLMSICQGYAKPRQTIWSSQGNNHTYNNMCAGENEERSPWEPFHVSKGFKPDESVVSVFRGWTFINSIGAANNRSFGEELNILFNVMPPLNSSATLILDPLVANNLKDNEGFKTRMDFAKWFCENIKITAYQYWTTDYIDMLVASEALKGVEPYASWKALPDDALINPYTKPENINIIVIGGETSPLWKAADYGYSGSQSVDKWRPVTAGDECADGTCGLPDQVGEEGYD